jgi:hypothetical protein
VLIIWWLVAVEAAAQHLVVVVAQVGLERALD